MSDINLFRKTPFNGYHREDVLRYLTECDQQQKQAAAAYEEQISALRESAGEGLKEKLREKTEALSSKAGILRDQIGRTEEEISSLQASFSGTAPEALPVVSEIEKALAESRGGGSAMRQPAEEKKELLCQLKENLIRTESELAGILGLRAVLAENEGCLEEAAEFQTQADTLRENDPKIALLRAQINEKEEALCRQKQENEELKKLQAELLSVKIRLSESEKQTFEEKERVLELQKQIAEKDEKIAGIEDAWQESKQKFLFLQKDQQAAGDLIKQAEEEKEKILAGAEQERKERLDAINVEIKNMLSGAVRESEQILATARERSEIIIKNARLSAAESMRKLSPIKESLSAVLSAIENAQAPEPEIPPLSTENEEPAE